MKTSTVIFLSFFGVITLFLVSNSFNIPEKYRKEHKNTFREETFQIQPFSYLVVANNCTIQLHTGETTQIKRWIRTDALDLMPVYHYSGDTLFMESTSKIEGNGLQLFTQNLRGITNAGAKLNIYLHQDSLQIKSDKGDIYLENDGDINTLYIDLNHTNIRCYDKCIQNLRGTANNSNFMGYETDLDIISLKITGNSEVHIGRALKIDVVKDKSSRFVIR